VVEVHDDVFRDNEDLYGPTVAHKMRASLKITDLEVAAALQARELYREGVAELMADLDLILTPTVPMVAPPAGVGDLELRGRMLSLTFAWNAIGGPALALPCGPAEDGLPASIQLLGKPGADALVLAAGRLLESQMRYDSSR
jgi:aspartyl-tRNA(Asn)/glutamyl-tRNA(Gln) amidotransferase subunit A